jgi:predicted unusual protein kinase regulating ubiquinone biosynthesis (AarF/ABC1/UbiB family)
VLARQLGARLSELDIDEQPIGAASLGQVYRARLRASGRQLCLKIQYPGVADAVESDITTLARIFSVSRLAPSGLDLQPIFGEIREMLRREVDFRREQRYTEAFRRLLADDPRFVVPEVLARYSTRRVLAMSYEDGLDVRDARVQALPQARRDRLGHALVQLFLRELFDWRMVQTDPNFGNYRFRLDRGGADQIVLLDFGATRRFSRGFARAYADVVRGGAGRDVDMIVRGAASLGILDASFPRPVLEGFARMCMVIAEPFSDPADGHIPARLLNAEGGYRWAESDLPNRAGRAMVASSMTVHYRLPPREIVFLHRRLSGIFMMLSALRAEFSARNDVHAAVQRFERAGAAQPG